MQGGVERTLLHIERPATSFQQPLSNFVTVTRLALHGGEHQKLQVSAEGVAADRIHAPILSM